MLVLEQVVEAWGVGEEAGETKRMEALGAHGEEAAVVPAQKMNTLAEPALISEAKAAIAIVTDQMLLDMGAAAVVAAAVPHPDGVVMDLPDAVKSICKYSEV